MRKICFIFTAALCFVFLLSGCGKNPKITQFKKDINTFCIDISNLDTAINGIDANTDTARTELLGYLDEIDQKFKEFAELDFPEEYKYLEALADESSKYMTEAVVYFHKTFSEEESFNEAYMEYARENYSRAWKRVQIIIAFLHGDEPEDVSLETNS